jgi:hypothetical protein
MSAATPVKVFVSSRRNTSIMCSSEQGLHVAVDATDNARDAFAYVAEQLVFLEKRRRRKIRHELRQDIVPVL